MNPSSPDSSPGPLSRNAPGTVRPASVHGLPAPAGEERAPPEGRTERAFSDRVQSLLDEVEASFAAGKSEVVFDLGEFHLKVVRNPRKVRDGADGDGAG